MNLTHTDSLSRMERALLLAIQKDERMNYRECADAIGLSSWSDIPRKLDTLAEKGYIARGRKGQIRAIRLTEKGRAYRP
jgi:DNA-binding MarR family transcriptional regulator